MNSNQPITDAECAAGRIRLLLDRCRAEGRRVLVVIGAGCSDASEMPLMSHVYKYLRSEIEKSPAAKKIGDADHNLNELRRWLEILDDKRGPRSIAARALGLFQQPHLLEGDDNDGLRILLGKTWGTFAGDFLSWKVRAPSDPNKTVGPTIFSAAPTEFHRRVAEWTLSGQAAVLSLNFDGLTRAAIEEHPRTKCAILTTASDLDGHWCGDGMGAFVGGDRKGNLHAVIKIMGDVFHAKCRDARCPAYDKSVALYDLRKNVRDIESSAVDFGAADERRATYLDSKSRDEARASNGDEAKSLLRCPDCGNERTLQIFFSGYEEKERDAEDVLNAARNWILPSIGGILTVGVSGLWDPSLVEFLTDAARNCQWDDKHVDADDRVLCIDPFDSYLFTELDSRRLNAVHLKSQADQIAIELRPRPKTEGAKALATDLPPSPSKPESRDLARDKMAVDWPSVLFQNGTTVTWPKPIEDRIGKEIHNTGQPMAKLFGQIRQLGLKTALVKSSDIEANGGKLDEKEHNRFRHSFHCSLIALEWAKRRLGESPMATVAGASEFSSELFQSIAFLACLLHDLNHLPFSHLAEEVFHELNWTTVPWADRFHHDTQVLDGSHTELRRWANKVLNEVANDFGIEKETLAGLVTRAVEGRSGIPVLDAIVNSPIDADKIEYLASDSVWMREEIHLPVRNNNKLKNWLNDFFKDQRVLPSGVIALAGRGAENAYQLLEERRWLYKHLYHRPGFRVVERVTRHLLARWLTGEVGADVANQTAFVGGGAVDDPLIQQLGAFCLGDTRAIKGAAASALLWKALISKDNDLEQVNAFAAEDMAGLADWSGEPRLAVMIARKLHRLHKGTAAQGWYEACNALLKGTLNRSPEAEYVDFEQKLHQHATWSPRMYVKASDHRTVSDIVRELEYSGDQSALVDLASVPRMLSYPGARRREVGSIELFADCWVVPHKDPDRWGTPTDRWVPLSKTAIAQRDQHRWVQVLIVSPRPNDQPALRYVEDRLRLECRKKKVEILDEDPELGV